MIHEMKLRNIPFQLIKTQSKTVEMRLYDDKRKLIKINDVIIFKNIETNEEISTRVIGLKKYRDFFELYKHFDKEKLGYNSDQVAKPEDMFDFYPKKEIEQFGVIAIEIQLV